MNNLNGISQVLIICMGSALQYSRVGEGDLWQNDSSPSHILSDEEILAKIKMYRDGGKSLIIPVLGVDQPGTSCPSFLPERCFEIREYMTLPNGRVVQGCVFWRDREPGKWRRMEGYVQMAVFDIHTLITFLEAQFARGWSFQYFDVHANQLKGGVPK